MHQAPCAVRFYCLPKNYQSYFLIKITVFSQKPSTNILRIILQPVLITFVTRNCTSLNFRSHNTRICPKEISGTSFNSVYVPKKSNEIREDLNFNVTVRHMQQILTSTALSKYSKSKPISYLKLWHIKYCLHWAAQFLRKISLIFIPSFSRTKNQNPDSPDCLGYYFYDLRTQPEFLKHLQQGGASFMLYLAISHNGIVFWKVQMVTWTRSTIASYLITVFYPKWERNFETSGCLCTMVRTSTDHNI